ncbi:small-conductance calcium-activated potassium channel protein, putative [Ichthyophthirius multifiliis]|uniref:Small-conductance calcium-activated potassium channel protein, putative n=1 Tax=Ichthyophthirius multifiliis TaxID=5932 RepID=G0QZJ6_ICHMU|nr:small-conductance calcium-activated potassium channel protein, putative [Ichthyophthirius multifiliis]EGR29357.1 small-conductance calcium-activated potassium channel protein, putative [Ichthyophthirius multifiliis]|eukprot:XP_004030593.1 small-conductance calcium-activated potassium channel protein, putative [Ichthyophthirius multifiliis]
MDDYYFNTLYGSAYYKDFNDDFYLIQPYQLISAAMGISIFYFSFTIMICEAPLSRADENGEITPINYYNYSNCIWNIIVTMTTVGYGDLFPRTPLGRFFIVIVCIWGVFIVSMMVLTLTVTLDTSSMENKSIVVLQRLKLRKEIQIELEQNQTNQNWISEKQENIINQLDLTKHNDIHNNTFNNNQESIMECKQKIEENNESLMDNKINTTIENTKNNAFLIKNDDKVYRIIIDSKIDSSLSA